MDNEVISGGKIKSFRVDTLLISKDKKHIVNVEMNRSRGYTEDRNREYLHRIAGNITKSGENYDKLKDYYIEQINFNNFYCKADKEVEVNTYKLTDNKYHLTIDNFKIHNIYIPKVKEACYNEIGKVMCLFTCESYEEMRKVSGDDKEMNLLVEELGKLNYDEFFGAIYNIEDESELLERSAKSEGYSLGKQEGLEQGLEQGIEQGSYNKAIETAKRMKDKNYDISTIMELTSLSEEEIEKL